MNKRVGFSVASAIASRRRDAGSRHLVSALRRKAEHDVKVRRQLARARFFEPGEVDDDCIPRLCVTNPSPDAIALLSWLSFEVILRGELILHLQLNGKVDVRRAPAVRHRLNRWNTAGRMLI